MMFKKKLFINIINKREKSKKHIKEGYFNWYHNRLSGAAGKKGIIHDEETKL